MIGGACFHSINDVDRRLFQEFAGLATNSISEELLSFEDIDDDELERLNTLITLEADISFETLVECIVLEDIEM